jgi:hypothetical protein
LGLAVRECTILWALFELRQYDVMRKDSEKHSVDRKATGFLDDGGIRIDELGQDCVTTC